jgi:hypothetical protein
MLLVFNAPWPGGRGGAMLVFNARVGAMLMLEVKSP